MLVAAQLHGGTFAAILKVCASGRCEFLLKLLQYKFDAVTIVSIGPHLEGGGKGKCAIALHHFGRLRNEWQIILLGKNRRGRTQTEGGYSGFDIFHVRNKKDTRWRN